MPSHATTTVTYHLDLNYAVGGSSELGEYWVKGYRSRHLVQAHTEQTRAAARLHSVALARMPDEHLARLTHFAEAVVVSDEVPHHVRVHQDAHGWPLPALVAMTIHVPARARMAARQGALGSADARDVVAHPTLAAYGVPAGSLEVSLAADQLITPLETAKSILFHHPELASIDPDTAAIVLDAIAATGGLNDLATAIARQGQATPTGGFATISACVGENDSEYTYNPDGPWDRAGQTVYQYRLSDETTGAVGQGPLREALRRTKQEARLRNRSWSVNLGRPSAVQPPSPSTAPRLQSEGRLATIGDTGGYSFTLNNKTPGHGLDVKDNSLSYQGGTFSLAATNDFLRTLSAYALFRNAKGEVLTNIEGFQGSWGGVFDFPEDGKYFLSLVTSVNAILGIPMPTDPTTLSFQWPNAATEADLLWGGIGTSDWDGDVVAVGFIATGIFQYGVPVMFLAAGAAIESSAWYKALAADKELMLALKVVGGFLFAAKTSTQAALSGVKSALASLGNAIGGILVSAGVEKLATWVFTKIAVAEAEDAIPFAGWAVRVANMLTTAAQIAETTVEVLSSPATYTVQVKRRLELQVTVHPDVAHGGPNAIWPTEADHWIAIVQYKDGTNYQARGNLPVGNDASKPVVTTIAHLPAGSQLQVSFGVYSSGDWLAGRWQGAWVDAILPAGQSQLAVEGSIQENLVPLTAQTQYHYTQKTAWNEQEGAHVWHTGDQPSQVLGDLNPANIGNNLGGLVGITLNDAAYMLGYCWTASGQQFAGSGCDDSGQRWSFANMSTLANPALGYKFSECGFSDQPFLIYDQFGPAPLFELSSSLATDLDAGKVTPSIEQAFAAANYPITNQLGTAVPAITVVTPTARWQVAVSGTNLYEVRRVTDTLQVFASPQPPFSPNNYYVDPKLVDGQVNYYLRQVVLDPSTPFGVDQPHKEAFGVFTIPNMDAFAVHPSGYVIAASWANSKLQVLKLPAAPVDDAHAEPALFLSGEGARQGLLHGPRALAVTADGRILVLETINQRIQAFDINGNPVHCFEGEAVPNLHLAAADVRPHLDAGVADVGLREAFASAGVPLSRTYRIDTGGVFYTLSPKDGQFRVTLGTGQDLSTEWTITDTTTGAAYQVAIAADGTLPVSQGGSVLFHLAATDTTMLDVSAVDADIIAEFTQAGHPLPEAADVTVCGNGYQVDDAFESALATGVISQDLRTTLRDQRGITLADDATVTASVTVAVIEAGKQWVLTEGAADISYRIAPDDADASTLGACRWDPTMALHVPDGAQQVAYLDLATELKGYIYVLGFSGAGNPTQSDYFLDIYSPNGKWLSRTPDGTDPLASNPNAAKMIVDQWRTMFTLNYEHYQGGHGTEPSVSEWVPSTPKGG